MTGEMLAENGGNCSALEGAELASGGSGLDRLGVATRSTPVDAGRDAVVGNAVAPTPTSAGRVAQPEVSTTSMQSPTAPVRSLRMTPFWRVSGGLGS